MVIAAVPMAMLSAMRMSEAQRLVPELYEHIPRYLRGYVAHEVRLDGKVAADTERLAALGDCAVRGIPLSLFPNFYLRFAGRIALYHYCKQKCHPRVLLLHCADGSLHAIQVRQQRGCGRSLLRGRHRAGPARPNR